LSHHSIITHDSFRKNDKIAEAAKKSKDDLAAKEKQLKQTEQKVEKREEASKRRR
jgi:hypothetical protein